MFNYSENFRTNLGAKRLELLNSFAQPVVTYVYDDMPTLPTQSFASGHCFLPTGETWPMNEHEQPLVFLMQINFAEMPPLEGFPTSGLLQWFVNGAHDTMGLTWDADSTGREGLFVRYYTREELDRESLSQPDSVLPYDETFKRGAQPLQTLKPHALTFEKKHFLPHFNEMYLKTRTEKENELEDLYETLMDTYLEYEFMDYMMPANTVGGTPVFIQGDCRKEGKPNQLVLQCDSDEVFMFGDAGTAQLFGSLEELKQGNVSDFWWDWACS